MVMTSDAIDRDTYRRDPVGAILAVAPELEPLLIAYEGLFRYRLAENPLSPPEVLRLMAYDSGNVLWRLADNPLLDVSTMERIADEVEYATEEGHPETHRTALTVLLQNIRCPEHLMRRFSHCSPGPIANHPNCPPDLLEQFSTEVTASPILCSVAGHPRSSTETLLNLLDKGGGPAPRRARIELARRGAQAVRAGMLRTDTRGRRHLAHLIGSAHRGRLARDPDPRIRLAIANVEEKSSVLRLLAADENGRVRRAASERVLSQLL